MAATVFFGQMTCHHVRLPEGKVESKPVPPRHTRGTVWDRTGLLCDRVAAMREVPPAPWQVVLPMLECLPRALPAKMHKRSLGYKKRGSRRQRGAGCESECEAADV